MSNKKNIENKNPSNEKKYIIVCVTAQPSAEFLINTAKLIAEKHSLTLEVLSIIPNVISDESFSDQVNYLYNLSKSVKAEIQIFRSDDSALTVAAHASKIKAKQIVTGFPIGSAAGFIEMLHLLVPSINITMANEKLFYNINKGTFTNQQIKQMLAIDA